MFEIILIGIGFVVIMYGLYVLGLGKMQVSENLELRGTSARIIGLLFLILPFVIYALMSAATGLIGEVSSDSRNVITTLLLGSLMYSGIWCIKKYAEILANKATH